MRIALVVLLASVSALAAEPWEAAPFTAEPAVLAGAAAALPTPPGAEVEVLLEEGHYAYDAQGRETMTQRLVYRVLTPEGVKRWATVAVGYAPWHEERPEVRARVMTPSGQAHTLDPATLVDATPVESDPETLSDRRVLRGPLPAISEGAVVEQLITTRETQSLFASGAARRFYFGKEVPVRKVRLTLEVPKGWPLHFAARGVRVKPQRTEENGRTRLSFEHGPLQPVTSPEPFLPDDAVTWPHVAFSTGEGWGALARRYHETVQTQLKGASLMAFGKQAVRAIPYLSLAREQAATDAERRGFDRDLMTAYLYLERMPEVLAAADRLLEVAPVDETAFFRATQALRKLNRPEEMARRAEARLKLLPDDDKALETLAGAATMRGDLAKAQEYRRRIVEAGKATAHTYNELAWNTLFLGKVDEAALEDALKANTLSSYGTSSYVHTLATLYAELGKGQEARQLLLKSLELKGERTLAEHDWYVLGRIAEGYGLWEEAKAAYARVKSPVPEVNSVDWLAVSRLEALESAPKAVTKPAP